MAAEPPPEGEGGGSPKADEVVDEYTDDHDPGYVVLEVTEDEFQRLHKEAMENILKARAALPQGAEEQLAAQVKGATKLMRFDNQEIGWISEPPPKEGRPKSASRPSSVGRAGRNSKTSVKVSDEIREAKAIELRKAAGLSAFHLKIIHAPLKTGFEVDKDFVPERDIVIAGRFQVEEFLGEAAFSTAIQCKDLASDEKEPESVCLKIIKNNKDYLDQSLDEIKLLHFINSRRDPDRYHVLRMHDYFYYKEHLFLVTELLKDNLYEYSRFIRHSGAEPYFTLPRLKKIMQQLLEAVAYIHSLNLVHCDIKPENILIQSYSQVKVKLIDFGSSCFTTDYLNSYVQSRSYRAPEVILGLPYGPKIDIWSLGAVVAELLTGLVLFQNNSIATMLARMLSVLGPMPNNMLLLGTAVNKYFLSGKMVFERHSGSKGAVTIMRAKKTTLKHRMHVQDDVFVDFVESLLTYDQMARPSALEALKHPWLADNNCDVQQFYRGLQNQPQNRDTGSSISVLRGSKKIPPKRMLSSKGKVVAKPATPRVNNATQKTRIKPGSAI